MIVVKLTVGNCLFYRPNLRHARKSLWRFDLLFTVASVCFVSDRFYRTYPQKIFRRPYGRLDQDCCGCFFFVGKLEGRNLGEPRMCDRNVDNALHLLHVFLTYLYSVEHRRGIVCLRGSGSPMASARDVRSLFVSIVFVWLVFVLFIFSPFLQRAGRPLIPCPLCEAITQPFAAPLCFIPLG